MQKPRHNPAFLPPDDKFFKVKKQKAVPYEFVLDALADLPTETRTMFGCLAVYPGDKIVLILRDGREPPADNGAWLASSQICDPFSCLGTKLPAGRFFRRTPQISSKQPCALAN